MIRRYVAMAMTIRRFCRTILIPFLALSLAGCATTTANLPSDESPMHTVSEVHEEPIAQIADPWEGFNRSMYKFNYNLDKYVLLPVVSGYEFVSPTFVQTGVSNFFNNLVEVRNLTNSIFQLKGMESLTTLGRFVTNSTIGIGGLFDPATSLGMKRHDEDFGLTLGHWGCNSGPYIVLPFLGPSNARDTSGFVVDAGIRYGIVAAIDPFENVDSGTETAIKAGVETLEVIDKRHQESFRYFKSEYPFEYDLIRFFYNKERDLEIMK
jgi:phospholipid-binding lipoprotein MlaA